MYHWYNMQPTFKSTCTLAAIVFFTLPELVRQPDGHRARVFIHLDKERLLGHGLAVRVNNGARVRASRPLMFSSSPSTVRKDVSTRTRQHYSNDGSGLHDEQRPQELAVSERLHSEHHDVKLRHDAQNNGDLHQHGLQILANVQRELRADQLVLPVACVWRKLQHLASVQSELQAYQLVLPLACIE